MIFLKIFLVLFLLFSLWRLWVTSRANLRQEDE